MTVVVIGLLALAATAVLVLLLLNASRGRRAAQDIPPALRPAYSDAELERKVLERYMAWGLAFTAFFAVMLPAIWLRESTRQTQKTQADFVATYERGEQLFVENCSRCHGQDAEGGGAPSTYDAEDSWPAPNLTTLVKRYEDAPIPDIREYLVDTLHRGRPGTPMPAWGADYGGPLTDQQIEDIADWILANQKAEIPEPQEAADRSGRQLFQQNCARCHGEELEGFIGPTLVGVFERHNEKTILGILRNGIFLANGVSMPPWQNGYLYEDARYSDEALTKIVDYLREQQPADLGEEHRQYQTPYGQGGPKDEDGGGNGGDEADGGDDTATDT